MRMWREEIKKGNTVLIEWNRYRKEQYQTEWELEIKSPSEKIDLDLLFVA